MVYESEAQMSQRDRATDYVSWNLAQLYKKIALKRHATGER